MRARIYKNIGAPTAVVRCNLNDLEGDAGRGFRLRALLADSLVDSGVASSVTKNTFVLFKRNSVSEADCVPMLCAGGVDELHDEY